MFIKMVFLSAVGLASIGWSAPAAAEQKYIECNTEVLSVRDNVPLNKVLQTIGFFIDDTHKVVTDSDRNVLPIHEFDEHYIKVLTRPEMEMTIDRRTGDIHSYMESPDAKFRETQQGKCAEALPPAWRNKF